MSFEDLGLSPEVLKAVTEAGYSTPTPIQEQAVPYVLMGRDVLGCAQTGTGKTASFTLPMIDILASGRARARMPRSLIIEPTRELAAQVSESFEKYGKYNKLSMALLIGGESFVDQEKKLDRGVDVLIATPGRLIDLFERGKILLADTKILVIDEADRMLDMGFIPDVERIVGLLPKIRQTLFFSATMPPEIRRLADAFLMNPKEVSVAPPASPAALVEQAMVRVSGLATAKRERLRELIVSEAATSALIFCNRKRDVTILYRSLKKHGYSVAELHGDLPQPSRMATLKSFKDGEVRLLVCSDVAARGLDIPKVSHVFNYDVPINAEDYVHRIGRTGRAGRSGKSFTLVTASDRKYLAAITKLIGANIHEVQDEGAAAPVAADQAEAAPAVAAEAPTERRRRRPRRERSGEKREAAAREPADGEPAIVESAAVESAGSESGEPEPARPDSAPQESAAREPAPRSSRRRGSGRRERGAPQEAPTNVEEALAAGDSVPSKPFGDHTPAFILRPVKIAATA